MANYFFPKDFKEGKAAEQFVAEYLKDKFSKFKDSSIRELERSEQSRGDLCVTYTFQDTEYECSFEVKFDKMAESTGNLCFEMANGKGEPTGIAATEANGVIYIVPKDGGVRLFTFDAKKLKSYLSDPANISKIRAVNGGDRRAYSLLLVSADNIIKDKLARVEEIDASVQV